MKLTAQVKLVVTPEQADALKRTMQAANAVCDSLSAWAWENQTFGQYPIHKGQYAAQRAASGLTAQVIVRAIGKVADSYKLDKRTQRTFHHWAQSPTMTAFCASMLTKVKFLSGRLTAG